MSVFFTIDCSYNKQVKSIGYHGISLVMRFFYIFSEKNCRNSLQVYVKYLWIREAIGGNMKKIFLEHMLIVFGTVVA